MTHHALNYEYWVRSCIATFLTIAKPVGETVAARLWAVAPTGQSNHPNDHPNNHPARSCRRQGGAGPLSWSGKTGLAPPLARDVAIQDLTPGPLLRAASGDRDALLDVAVEVRGIAEELLQQINGLR